MWRKRDTDRSVYYRKPTHELNKFIMQTNGLDKSWFLLSTERIVVLNGIDIKVGTAINVYC